MNKLTKYIAMFLWVVITAFAIYYFLFPRSEDYKALNRSLIGVTNQYLNDRDVEPKSVGGSGKYFDLIRLLAVNLKEKQEIERKFETETKLLMVSISSDSLGNPASVDAGIARADNYEALVQDANARIAASVANYQKGFDNLIEDGDKMVPQTSLFRKVDKAVEAKSEQGKVRSALAQHVKALLVFVKSRNGYFQVAPANKLTFSTPEDQAYYDQMYERIYDLSKRLDGLVSGEKITFRQDLSIELPPGQDYTQ